MRKGLRDFLATFGGRIGAMFLGILSQVILARVLGPAGRGSLYICQVYQSTLALIFAVGCDTAAVYYVSSRRYSLSEGVTYTLVNGSISSLLAVGAGWLMIYSGLEFFDKASPADFRISLLLVPITLFSMVFHTLLTAVGRFGAFGTLVVIRSLVQVVATILLVQLAGWGVSGGLWATIAAYASALAGALYILFGRERARLVKPCLPRALEMFSYGARYYLGKLSNTANMQIGPIIIGFLAKSEAELGYFSVAHRLLKQIESIPEALVTTLLPRVAEAADGRKHLVAQTARVTLVVCGGILLAIALLANPLISILYGSEFAPAVPPLQILCLGIGIRCLGKVVVPYLVGTNHPGFASL
ncbi:MAG TPA: oligosaccharide flippase family protein, partial [bacterium]|nr:oligosaccharide flippase family protein [bacterium]